MTDVSVPSEIAKSSIPAGYIVGTEFLGLSADGWITALTLLYLICQLVIIAPRISNTIAKHCLALTLLIKSKWGKDDE